MNEEPHSTVIEIIAADPRAFGGSEGDVRSPSPAFDLRRWRIPLAALTVITLATVAVLAWHPWRHPPPLTNRLLLDRATSQVLDVRIDQPGLGNSAAEVGFVYAEPGAALPMLRSAVGRSVTWISYAADSINAAFGVLGPEVDAVADVQGTPARLTGASGSVVRVGFGPLEGRMYYVTTNGLTEESALRFANSIGVENGEPVLHDEEVLQGMEPVGSYDAFTVALGILDGAYYAPSTTPLTRVDYVDGGGAGDTVSDTVSVSSATDGHDGEMLGMLSLLLGTPADRRVHGHPAFAVDIRPLSNQEQQAASIVAWHERGRFIVVAGPGDVASTVALAETTHEATEAEWSPVASQAITNDSTGPGTIGFRREADGSITDVSAGYSQPGGLTLCLNGQFGDECAVEDITSSPFLKVMRIHTEALLVALVTGDAASPELRVSRADGSVDIHLLFRPGRGLPGSAVAVFLPDDFVGATLIVDGKVVATM